MEKKIRVAVVVSSAWPIITAHAKCANIYVAGRPDYLGTLATQFQADATTLGVRRAKREAIEGVQRAFTQLWNRNIKAGGFDNSPFKFVRV